MTDIEEIRRRRMQELQQQQAQQAQNQSSQAESQEQMRREVEAQKRQAMMQLLTPEARARLTNIRLTKPEFVDQIELQLIQLAQMGRVQNKITDDQLKELLRKLAGQKREINITRR
ncbi:DNA-binding protein [Methanobacterium lacus]|jgi:programmed cell death protein 5|uniref:DNA-binding protein Metbo_0541 n=1 Tax=Methanobacterium lacus (strain AL-21) TaxID=877455 RepID=F0T9X0_METLA|nr:DNA-binding protein [Methanobacterium lacus]ADZ08793.1 DNA-binding protein [Methanobacterium lacus]